MDFEKKLQINRKNVFMKNQNNYGLGLLKNF